MAWRKLTSRTTPTNDAGLYISKCTQDRRGEAEFRRLASNVPEKLWRLKLKLRLRTNRELADFLDMPERRLGGLLYYGLKIREEERTKIDSALLMHGIEIKEKIISFD